jgi:branched-chain amino acid transport system ATP-binding protein
MRVLEAIDITKRFGGLVAVDSVSMHVDEGEIVGLIGPNGAGKTTFLNAIIGLDPPTSGSIQFFGQKVTGISPEKMCHLGLTKTFQIPQPFPKMTVFENVMVASAYGNRKRVKDPIKNALMQLKFVEFPLPPDIESDKLNAVELKRLDLARALATSPKMLLLDEIASGLTEGELNDLILIIKKIRDYGISILIVEHIMHVITNLCERLVVINYGNKIADGITHEVIRDPNVQEAYFGVSKD